MNFITIVKGTNNSLSFSFYRRMDNALDGKEVNDMSDITAQLIFAGMMLSPALIWMVVTAIEFAVIIIKIVKES